MTPRIDAAVAACRVYLGAMLITLDDARFAAFRLPPPPLICLLDAMMFMRMPIADFFFAAARCLLMPFRCCHDTRLLLLPDASLLRRSAAPPLCHADFRYRCHAAAMLAYAFAAAYMLTPLKMPHAKMPFICHAAPLCRMLLRFHVSILRAARARDACCHAAAAPRRYQLRA